MNSTEFAYWLMGYFEISDVKIENLSQKQTIIIKKHLELVFKADKNPSPFCNWLKGFLDRVYLTEEKDLNNESIETILKELKKIFKHVIDLSYDENLQNELNSIHNYEHNIVHNNDPNNPVVRC